MWYAESYLTDHGKDVFKKTETKQANNKSKQNIVDQKNSMVHRILRIKNLLYKINASPTFSGRKNTARSLRKPWSAFLVSLLRPSSYFV